jgi:hypothetical protein
VLIFDESLPSRPGSYFLLPYRQAFAKDFPRDFTVFLSLRPTEESEVSGRRKE